MHNAQVFNYHSPRFQGNLYVETQTTDNGRKLEGRLTLDREDKIHDWFGKSAAARAKHPLREAEGYVFRDATGDWLVTIGDPLMVPQAAMGSATYMREVEVRLQTPEPILQKISPDIAKSLELLNYTPAN
jgi:hypothetical protein